VPEQQTFLSLITGSFATPAAENPTVAMIEAAYEHHHINARYLNCDVAPDALGDAVRGARAIVLDGLGMLVSQGAISIRHWTGIDPEPKIMRKKLEQIFGL
jgi:shikimate dehydrogenase